MLYFELSYFDQAEAPHASYRKFFDQNREHFSDDRLEMYQNFLKCYKKLRSAKEEKPLAEAADVMIELKNISNVIESDWLLKKASEIKNQF